MSAELVTIGSAAVVRDSARPWRWLMCDGPNVTSWRFDAYHTIVAGTTAVDGYTHTAMTSGNVTTTAGTGADGGGITITAGVGDNQGGQLQHVVEGFYFAQKWPAYFGICLALTETTAKQSDFVAGLCITDASIIDAFTDGIYFRSNDGSDVIYGCTEKDNAASESAVGSYTGGVYVTLEWQFDGAKVTYYVNGAEAGSTLYTSATFPNDEYLTPTIAFLTGAAEANSITVKWAKAWQIREAA